MRNLHTSAERCIFAAYLRGGEEADPRSVGLHPEATPPRAPPPSPYGSIKSSAFLSCNAVRKVAAGAYKVRANFPQFDIFHFES